METININKSAIIDLVKLTHEINNRVESLELMGDKEFVESLRKSKEEIKNRKFADWNEL